MALSPIQQAEIDGRDAAHDSDEGLDIDAARAFYRDEARVEAFARGFRAARREIRGLERWQFA